MSNRYKIIVAYDGTFYYGWQMQTKLPTIAGTLQKSFQAIFHAPISLLGASRTDAGVHALGQVATFCADMQVTPASMLKAWSNSLPPDIVIRSLDLVSPDFNPHRDVLYKTYWYHFFVSRPHAFTQRYGLFFRLPLDLDKLQECLQIFVGTHDFRSFCTGDEMEDDTIRTVDSITLSYQEQYDAYRIEVRGPRFLRHMIRRMVGAALDVAARKMVSSDYLRQVLEEKNPRQNLINAAPQGLLLHEIIYKKG